MNRRLLSIVIALSLASIVCPLPARATPFVHESIQAAVGAAGGDVSVAIDSKGQPHVSFAEVSSGGRVRYARRAGGVWTIETVQTTGLQDWWTSMELDSADEPRIAYDVGGFVTYARKSGGVWTVETVSNAVTGDHYISLALDASGNPHISYRNFLVELWHAAKSGGVWTVQRVDATGGNRSSIAVDHDGNPRIASIDSPTSGNLEYASKAGGVWTVETVMGTAIGSSIALDGAGRPHISVFNTTTDDLVYVTKASGTWAAAEVVDAFTLGPSSLTFISISQAGLPRIAYGDPMTSDLKFAARAATSWASEVVALINGSVFWIAMALDRQDNPTICYLDSSDNSIKLADSSVRLLSPLGGGTWAVGSQQSVRWAGAGAVNILLSADGGATFTTLRSSVNASPYTFRVPHLPTRFAALMVSRSSPLSTAVSDSFFTIDATIALAKFEARVVEEGDALSAATPVASGDVRDSRSMGWTDTRRSSASPGRAIALAWETRPGPEADILYRVERAAGSGGGAAAFVPAHDGLLAQTELVDRDEAAMRDGGTRYRLIAVNGLGEEYALGETSIAPALAADREIVAYPNPASGPIEILYRVASDRPIELTVFDVTGRRICTLASGAIGVGVQSATWDRRDTDGRDVSAGTYFVRLSAPNGYRVTERITVVR